MGKKMGKKMGKLKKLRRFYGKRKVSFRNHRHVVKSMRGLTSVPVRFRGRKIS